MLGEPGGLECGKVFAGVVRRAGQRARRHQQEALGLSDRRIGLELVRGNEADHRMVLFGRLQVLPDRQEIDIGGAQIVAPRRARP